MGSDIECARRAATLVAERFAGVSLVVLFGSRARGDARAASDWDIAYATTAGVDLLALRAAFVDALATDRIDLVDLDKASALLRFRVARDGVPLIERPQGAFARFWKSAVHFWCDVAPLVRAGHEAIIADVLR